MRREMIFKTSSKRGTPNLHCSPYDARRRFYVSGEVLLDTPAPVIVAETSGHLHAETALHFGMKNEFS